MHINLLLLSPSNFEELHVVFFVDDTDSPREHVWAAIILVWLVCFAPSALSMTTEAQRQKWSFMKTPPTNSSFHIFLLFFFYFSSFVFHKQEAKGHFHLVISHIRRTSKHSFIYSVYLHRYESVSFIEWSALKSYYPHAAQLTYSQLLASADISFWIYYLWYKPIQWTFSLSVCTVVRFVAYRLNLKQPLWCK